jgi:uncharacterized protein YycO
MTELVFLGGLAIGATTLVMVARAVAAAIGGRGVSRSEIAELREQLDQHAAALGEIESSLSHQSPQLAELQERLDFAERLLAQGRDRTALGPGEQAR